MTFDDLIGGRFKNCVTGESGRILSFSDDYKTFEAFLFEGKKRTFNTSYLLKDVIILDGFDYMEIAKLFNENGYDVAYVVPSKDDKKKKEVDLFEPRFNSRYLNKSAYLRVNDAIASLGLPLDKCRFKVNFVDDCYVVVSRPETLQKGRFSFADYFDSEDIFVINNDVNHNNRVKMRNNMRFSDSDWPIYLFVTLNNKSFYYQGIFKNIETSESTYLDSTEGKMMVQFTHRLQKVDF